jgi:hypothetical protein
MSSRYPYLPSVRIGLRVSVIFQQKIESQIHILQCSTCENCTRTREEYITNLVRHFEDHCVSETTTRVVIANVRVQNPKTSTTNISTGCVQLIIGSCKRTKQIRMGPMVQRSYFKKWGELYLQNMIFQQEQPRHNKVNQWGENYHNIF